MPNHNKDIEIAVGRGEGIYLFCFARPHVLHLKQPSGLDDRYPLSQWTFKDVMAVLSKISLHDFCGPLAESRMQDLSWVGPRACRHEEVVEQVLQHSPVFPARFGTIFCSLESLVKLLKMHHTGISQFLDEVADKEEWAVKGLMDRGKAKDELASAILGREASGLASMSPGARYFQEQRIRNNAGKELSCRVNKLRKDVANSLGQYACRFCERRLLSREATGTDMIVNWAFLILKDSVPDFRARVAQAKEGYEKQGLKFELSGPWPPYSFCPFLTMK
jgi:hypothetical protein